jgi:hypothetical protein
LPPNRHGPKGPAPGELTKAYRPVRRLGVPKSERTTSREDPVSGRLWTEAKARAAHPSSKTPDQQIAMATPGSPFAHFASVDWAKHKHHAVILNPADQTVAAFDFDHTAAGWRQWREQAARLHDLPAEPQSRESAIASAKPPAAPRAILWTPGALPMRCGWMGSTGNRSAGRTRRLDEAYSWRGSA